MARKELVFFFDCLSPFSYFGFSVLKRYAPEWNINLTLKPALLGGLMAATNNTPPMMRPAAGAQMKWVGQDMERNRNWFNVPEMKQMPSNFFGSEGPADKTGLSRDFRYMRFLTAVSVAKPEILFEATERVFAMIWSDERDEKDRVVITEDRLEGICKSCGVSAEEAASIVKSVNDKEVKDQLKANVAAALELGAFGVPFIVIEDNVYFGSDRFEQLAFTHGLAWHGPDPKRPSAKL